MKSENNQNKMIVEEVDSQNEKKGPLETNPLNSNDNNQNLKSRESLGDQSWMYNGLLGSPDLLGPVPNFETQSLNLLTNNVTMTLPDQTQKNEPRANKMMEEEVSAPAQNDKATKDQTENLMTQPNPINL